MRTRLLFRCDAGGTVGLGHVMRSLVLAEAFAKRGFRPEFVTATGVGFVGAERIASRGFHVLAAVAPAGSAEDRHGVEALLNQDTPTVLIVDSKQVTPATLELWRQNATLLVIDDDALGPLPAHLLLNSRIDASPALYTDDLPDRDLLLGPLYNLVDPAYFSLRRPPAPQVRRVLVSFGGEDPHNHTQWAIRTLLHDRADIAIDVVVGPAHPAPESLRRLAQADGRISLVEQPSSLVPFIAEADLAITAGGTTVFELAAAGIPMLVVVIEDHQHHLAGPLAALGAAVLLGNHHHIEERPAIEACNKLMAQPTARAAMQAAQMKILPEAGAARVVVAVEKYLAQHRKAA